MTRHVLGRGVRLDDLMAPSGLKFLIREVLPAQGGIEALHC